MRLHVAVTLSLLLAPAASAGSRHALPGAEVRIWNLAGEVVVVPSSGRTVTVEVSPEGRDGGRLRVEEGTLDGAQTLRVIYPQTDRVVYRRRGSGWNSTSNLTVMSDGRFNMGRGSRGRRITVATGGRGLEAHANLRIEVPRGQSLRVYVGVGDLTATHVNGEIVLDVGSGHVRAEGSAGRLSVDTGSGAVDVHGHEGELLVDTGSGGVDVTDVRGPRVHVDTGSGGVRAATLHADRVDIDTGSGGVDLASVAARDVMVDTGSGAVRMELLDDQPNVVVDTGSGGVSLIVPASLSARLDLDTGSGGITCSLPMSVHSRGSSELRGTVGSGAGAIRVETGSGGIRIVEGRGRR